jgi:hypothetical protein
MRSYVMRRMPLLQHHRPRQSLAEIIAVLMIMLALMVVPMLVLAETDAHADTCCTHRVVSLC